MPGKMSLSDFLVSHLRAHDVLWYQSGKEFGSPSPSSTLICPFTKLATILLIKTTDHFRKDLLFSLISVGVIG